jgi:molybdate transport system substrate-binding protein
MRFIAMRSLCLLAFLLVSFTVRAEELTVFAAASLTDAMKDISAKWADAGHQPLRMSFGSSSTLARQIEQGAPVNLFASADEKWMDYLADKNLIAADTRKDLLGNDLVLVVPSDKPLRVTINKSFDLADLLGAKGRLATGDPAHVPVGIYAEQSLKSLGMWDKIQPKLARTDDVRSALLLVERGEAPAGIVYATDAAVSKAAMIAGIFPADSHDPVSYPFAVTKTGDDAEARALMNFLSGPVAHAVFQQRGFKVE